MICSLLGKKTPNAQTDNPNLLFGLRERSNDKIPAEQFSTYEKNAANNGINWFNGVSEDIINYEDSVLAGENILNSFRKNGSGIEGITGVSGTTSANKSNVNNISNTFNSFVNELKPYLTEGEVTALMTSEGNVDSIRRQTALANIATMGKSAADNTESMSKGFFNNLFNPTVNSEVNRTFSSDNFSNFNQVMAAESFLEKDYTVLKADSVVLNMLTPDPDAFTEGFYPTNVNPQHITGITLSTTRFTLLQNTGGTGDGNPYVLGKVNLNELAKEHTGLNLGGNELFPTRNANTESKFIDVAKYPNETITLHNDSTIETNLLKTGVSIDYMSITTDKSGEKVQGIKTDRKDTLTAGSKLKFYALEMSVTGNATPAKTYKFDVTDRPNLMFGNHTNQADDKKLTIDTEDTILNLPIRDHITGDVVADSVGIPGVQELYDLGVDTLRINVKVNGTLDMQTSVVRFNPQLNDVLGLEVAPIDLNSTPGVQAILNDFVGSFVGFDIAATKSQELTDLSGPIMDTQTFTVNFPIGMTNPTTSEQPVNGGKAAVDKLRAAAKYSALATNADAITHLQETHAKLISAFGDTKDKVYNTSVGRDVFVSWFEFHMAPYVRDFEIDLTELTAALQTSDIEPSIQNVLFNTLNEEVSSILERTFIRQVRADAAAKSKIRFVVGTSEPLARFLGRIGEDRDLLRGGDDVDPNLHIVTSIDRRITFEGDDNKHVMYLALYAPEDQGPGGSPLGFGNRYTAGKTIIDTVRHEGNKQHREYVTLNNEVFVNHQPVLVKITVKGLFDVMTSAASINVQNTPTTP